MKKEYAFYFLFQQEFPYSHIFPYIHFEPIQLEQNIINRQKQ